MKFYLISKSDYSKYESSKSSNSNKVTTEKSGVAKKSGTTKASVTTEKEVKSTNTGTTKDFFRQRRELKRRIRQAVQRYIKRAFIQRKNWSLFAQ